MMFEALASSSSGNAYIVSDRETRILLECGLSHRKLKQLTGFELTSFAGVLVSHEHKDHARCVDDLIKDGLRVYMSLGTAEALGLEEAELVEAGEQFNIGSLDVVPFDTFHDAAEPLGFLIRSRLDGEVLAFATDTVNLRYHFPGVTKMAIEANYDKEILARCTKMPEQVRHRITCSHMEIDTLCEYLQGLDLRSCECIYLLHLSDATSHEGHFINKVKRAVPPWCGVVACGKEVSDGKQKVPK